MAYDRYDTRNARVMSARDGPTTTRDRENRDGRRDERGFFERAGDEIASWFGDDEAERRRREDQMRDGREGGWSSRDRDYGRSSDRDRDWYQTRGLNGRGGWSESDYNRVVAPRTAVASATSTGSRERGYRPMTGDYGRGSDYRIRASSSTAASVASATSRAASNGTVRIAHGAAIDYRRTSRAGTSDRSDRSRHDDPALQQLAQPPHERARPRL